MIFHKHIWTVLSQEEQPSPCEVAAQSRYTVEKYDSWRPSEFFERPVIVRRKCSRCGTEEVVRV